MPESTRRASQSVLALVVAVLSLAALGLPASAATVSGPDEVELLRLHNETRAAGGRAPLADDVAARDVARAWARSMADSGTLRHNPNLADQVSRQVTNQWTRVGENVGRGPNLATINQAFLNSTAHRNNINGDYNRVGIGAARDANGQLWVAVVFVKGPALPVVPRTTWSPFRDPYAFVEQQYHDFLNRGGDAAGVEGWATQLRAGRMTAAAGIESFMGSREFAAVVAPAVRLYFAAFGRIPDQAGLQGWIGAARTGTTTRQIAESFAGSNEFRSRYTGMSNRQFVDALYRNVFGRPADPTGMNGWAGGLDSGRLTRGQVLDGLAQSPEFIGRSRNRVQVTMSYVGMLRRAPDQAGFQAWVAELDRGRSVRDLINGFLGSQEYTRRITG